MTLFAHIETGQALDPWNNDTQGEYLDRFSGVNTDGWVIAEVPDGTCHGAKSNGDGTYTNQIAPTPPVSFRALDKSQFEALYSANNLSIMSTLANWPTNE